MYEQWSLTMFAEGEQIGAYKIRQRLGAGGMGAVFLAEHRYIERRAAIKVLLPDLSTNQEVVARFFNEARAASRIKHPGIVEIVDCDCHTNGQAFIVMEFLEGESLGACLRRLGRLDTASVVSVGAQVAMALAAAHAKNIIHRDLKPDNIFLASTPEAQAPITVKVLDFGIAKLAGDGGPEARRTQTGSLIGTPLYMSPEQCRGTGRIDHRADIYSLGCILFELAAGRPPFVREGAGELFVAHISDPAPDLANLAPVPAGISALVASMLQKDPALRPQSMGAVVAALEQQAGVRAAEFAGMLPVPEGFPPALPDLPPVAATPVTATPRPPTAPTDPSRRAGSPGLPRTTPFERGSGSGARVSGAPAAARSSSGGTVVLPESQTTLGQTASERQPNLRPSVARGKIALVAIGAIGAAAIAGILLLRSSPLPPKMGVEAPPTAVEPPARTEMETEAAPKDTEIDVTSTPAGAEVWVAHERAPRGRTPLRIRVSAAAPPMEVLFKAPPGYTDRKTVLDPSAGTTLEVALDRQAPKLEAPTRRTTSARATRRRNPASVPDPEVSYPVMPDRPAAVEKPKSAGSTPYPIMPD